MFDVWVIEDDESHQFVYSEGLKGLFKLRFFDNIAKFKAALKTATPHLLIADLRLPDESFLSYLERNHAKLTEFPIIVVSSVDDTLVLKDCFKFGVRDYLTKPFNTNELIVKIDRLRNEIYLADLKFDDVKSNLITRAGDIINFTPKEYQILRSISLAPKMTLDRSKIMYAVWKNAELSGNAIDVHIHAIRKKLEGYGLSIVFVVPNSFKIAVHSPNQAIG